MGLEPLKQSQGPQNWGLEPKIEPGPEVLGCEIPKTELGALRLRFDHLKTELGSPNQDLGLPKAQMGALGLGV